MKQVLPLCFGSRQGLGPQVVGGSLRAGALDRLGGTGFDRHPAPLTSHRHVGIQGLREPLASQ